jgi:hypothetical protein
MEFFNFMLSGWTKAGDTGVLLHIRYNADLGLRSSVKSRTYASLLVFPINFLVLGSSASHTKTKFEERDNGETPGQVPD